MNTGYADASIQWKLAGTTRTTNADWFNNIGPDTSSQLTMKKSLRKGDATDLNVYTVGYVKSLCLYVFQKFCPTPIQIRIW